LNFFVSQFAQDLRKLTADLIDSRPFQRLKKVAFLGAIERFAGFASHERGASAGSRYDHSIGVANLTLQLADQLHLSVGEGRIALAHALLHDVGHGPFSHSSEHFFFKKFRMNHHHVLQHMVENKASEISKILQSHNLWFDYRKFVREPSRFPLVASLFYAPINADTVEGILRSAEFFGVKELPDQMSIISSVRRWSIAARPLDDFWHLKDEVYNEYILQSEYACYDQIVCDALSSVAEQVRKSDFFLDDEQFEERYRGPLHRQLRLKQITRYQKSQSRRRIFDIDYHTKPKKLDELTSRYRDEWGEYGIDSGGDRQTPRVQRRKTCASKKWDRRH